MVNDTENCFKIAETKEKVYELERLEFKPYIEPNTVSRTNPEKTRTARKRAVKKDAK